MSMDEMRSMIGARSVALGLRARTFASPGENALGRSQSSDSVVGPSRQAESIDPKRLIEAVRNLATTAEDNVSNAASSHSRIEIDLGTLVSAYEECSSDLMRAKAVYESESAYYEERELHSRELELENSAIFQEFNEQLESLFDNVSLPHDEAWTAMANDVTQARQEAQQLRHDNGVLQRKLREIEARETRWEALLREHGLIS